MLEIKNVSFDYVSHSFFTFRKKPVLRHVNLKVGFAQSVAIMGNSGCGKSTLAKIAAALLSPSKDEQGNIGRVLLEGRVINLSNLALRRNFYQKVQILFQDSIGSFNPHYSNLENCLEPLRSLSLYPKQEWIKKLTQLAQDLALPKDILSKNIRQISGGEAQRIALIRALSIDPKLLILDESTSGLDYELTLMVIEYLKQWQTAHQSSILLITHDDEIARLCHRVYMMNPQGELELLN